LLNQGAGGGGPAACESAFFEGQVMGLIIRPICANCHVPGGAAQAASFRVDPNDALATQQAIAQHINMSNAAASPILTKPLGNAHGGGVQIVAGSANHQILADWVDQVIAGEQCDTGNDVAMVPLASTDLLLRASMDLRGRRPSMAQLDAVTTNPDSYYWAIEDYLHSGEFLQRVKDVYDDALLVRREDNDPMARAETAAIYGEALELISYIPAESRPDALRDGAGVGDRVADHPLPRRALPRRHPVDECLLRGLGHEQHQQESPARQSLVDRVSLL
jgi:hypothetical protein